MPRDVELNQRIWSCKMLHLDVFKCSQVVALALFSCVGLGCSSSGNPSTQDQLYTSDNSPATHRDTPANNGHPSTDNSHPGTDNGHPGTDSGHPSPGNGHPSSG